MPFSRMDPSCTIGFYAKNKKDFESLCSAVTVVSFSEIALKGVNILDASSCSRTLCSQCSFSWVAMWQCSFSEMRTYIFKLLCILHLNFLHFLKTWNSPWKSHCDAFFRSSLYQVWLSPQALSSSTERYPIFTFVEGRSQDYGLEAHSSCNTGPAAQILPTDRVSNNRRNSDEFVFL